MPLSSGSIGSHRAFMGVGVTMCILLALILFLGWRWYFEDLARRNMLIALAEKHENRARELENLGLTVDAAKTEPEPVSVLPKIAPPETISPPTHTPPPPTPPPVSMPASTTDLPASTKHSPVPTVSTIKELPFNETGDEVVQALALLDQYWKTEAWAERVPLVFNSDGVSPLMKNYYEQQKGADPAPGGMINKARYQIDGTEILYFSYTSSRPTGTLEVAMRRGPDGKFLVDWESLVGYGEMSFQEFRVQRPAKPVSMRTYVRLFEYYNFEFSDSSKYLCVKLTAENGESSVYAYAERGTELCRWLETDLASTGPTGFKGYTMLVSFPANAQSNQCVHLNRVLTPRWLVLP
jgi:hypothetical protein